MVNKTGIGKAKTKKLPSSLRNWAQSGVTNETRTLIFRIARDSDPDKVSQQLSELDVSITSTGAAVIVGTVPRGSILRAAEVKGVVRIEEPSRLSPKGDNTESDLLSFRGGKKLGLPGD